MGKKTQSKDFIRILVKKQGGMVVEDLVPNTLETFQRLVGGYIETVMLPQNTVMIVNEEGKLKGLPHNFFYAGDDIVGTAVFCSQKNGDFTDIRPDAVKYVLNRFYGKDSVKEVI